MNKKAEGAMSAPIPYRTHITILLTLIAILSAAAALAGVFSTDGPGPWEHESVRGETVRIDGQGIYRHMSADVAPQGRAQDVVTLVAAIPLLLIALAWSRGGSVRARLLLAGTVMYFLVTYIFYLAMGTYNVFFLAYVALTGCAAATLALLLIGLQPVIRGSAQYTQPAFRHAGTFLIVNAVAITILWLGVVLPPLLDGSIIPLSVQHYTTLIVQGFDLALLLPLAFITGIQCRRGTVFGFMLGPVYLVFLAILMTALTAKIIAMAMLGENVIPAVIIIPAFNLAAIYLSLIHI